MRQRQDNSLNELLYLLVQATNIAVTFGRFFINLADYERRKKSRVSCGIEGYIGRND